MNKEQLIEVLNGWAKVEEFNGYTQSHGSPREFHEMSVGNLVSFTVFENEEEWKQDMESAFDEEVPSIEEYCEEWANDTDHNAETYWNAPFKPHKPFVIIETNKGEDERFINLEDCTVESVIDMINEAIDGDNPQTHYTGIKPQYEVKEFIEL